MIKEINPNRRVWRAVSGVYHANVKTADPVQAARRLIRWYLPDLDVSTYDMQTVTGGYQGTFGRRRVIVRPGSMPQYADLQPADWGK
jgi:hypothetical protein